MVDSYLDTNEQASQQAMTELDIALALSSRLHRHISERRLNAMTGRASWRSHGDAQHLREQLQNLLVCLEAGPDGDEAETLEVIRQEIGA